MPEETKPVAAERARRSRTMLIVLPPILLMVGVGWFLSARGKEPAAEASRVRSTLHLDTFVLNLADPDQRSYLRVGVDLGLRQEAGTSGGGPPIARVRDTILGVLAQAHVDELLSAKGKNQLKEDLLHALQERVPELGVEEIYFTEFLIQR